jgi:putative restriction endonuclease
MKIYIGITDTDWYTQLKAIKPEEVNFWQPGGNTTFRALPPEGLFLFKLHHPRNFIVGGGYFVRHSFLPASLAWKAFGTSNGVMSLGELVARVRKYKKGVIPHDPQIGCIILTQPFFLEESQWIPIPESFKKNIVSGRTYDLEDNEAKQIVTRLQESLALNPPAQTAGVAGEPEARYGNPLLVRPRLGQGAFRVIIPSCIIKTYSAA